MAATRSTKLIQGFGRQPRVWRLLAVCHLLLLQEAQVVQPQSLATALIARYDLQEGRGDIAKDASGNGFHATIHGATWEKLRVGHALRFDGEDDFVDCGERKALDWTGPITLEAWVRPSEVPDGETFLIGKGLGSYALTYSGREYPARLFWHIGSLNRKSRARVVATLWHHVVASFDGRRLRIWIDGTAAGGVRVWRHPPAEPGNRFLIGGGVPGLKHFKGLVSAVKVYRGVMSGTQAFERYERSKSLYLSEPVTAEPLTGEGIKVLNNAVAELLNVRDLGAVPEREFTFTNPRSPMGWVFISTTAQVKGGGRALVTLDGEPGEVTILHDRNSPVTQEAMRLLTVGGHTLRIRWEGAGVVERLVVRSIPELIFGPLPVESSVAAFGPHTWEYLEKHVLRNSTTLIGLPEGDVATRAEAWRKQGKKWIAEHSAGWFDDARKKASETADDFYRTITSRSGMRHQATDGVLLDTHDVGHNARYLPYAEAIRTICRKRAFQTKKLYLYCDSLYGAQMSERFAQAAMECGYPLVWTRYLHEQPHERAARAFIEAGLAQEAIGWERALPGFIRRAVVALGYLTSPGERLNVEPGASYLVFMDMQCNVLANHPAFRGVGGIMWYKASYANEEELRWGARLLRHYFIDGNTAMLSRDPYELEHIRNPDFSESTAGWNLEPAEFDGMDVHHVDRYGFMQGRWLETGVGDYFLWTRRNSRRENRFWQEIRNLEPGRLYTVSLYVSDYRKNIVERRSAREHHAVRLEITNADPVPAKSFVHVYSNFSYYHLGPFDDEEPRDRSWINVHRRVFRARGRTARLAISDWLAPGTPGGPVGQELMFNFIEIQPSLD